MSASIVVSVRVRPFNAREIKYQSRLVVRMPSPGLTEMLAVKNGKFVDEPPKKFNFDNCLWSHDAESPDFAPQEAAYQVLGKPILDNSLAGFNSCLFAYGQTGSGKTYTMMGSPSDPGVIPRLCDDLFARAESLKDTHQIRVECSYLEIYNEQVRDLLNPAGMDQTLRVRQHPKLGVFVEGLKKMTTRDKNEIDKLIADGAKIRSVAATNMNATSSRSHAILTLNIYVRGPDGELSSQLHLVDLAGSERATSTGATGDTLTEGANINKSLTTLGMCLSRLAEVAASDGKNKGHIPYRDSQLTWLLHDSLGGNSKTAMLANISPADINYEETLSTLRFAATTKKIKTNAVVNEDPQQKLIRELREEIAELKLILAQREAGIEVPLPSSMAEEGQDAGDGTDGQGAEDGDVLRSSSVHMATSDLVDGLAGLTEKMIELIRTDDEVAQDDEAARCEYEKQMQAFDQQFGAVFLDNSVPRLSLLNEDVVGLVTAAAAIEKSSDACCDVELAYYFKEASTDIGCAPTCGIRLPRSSAAMREVMATVVRSGADSNSLTISKHCSDATITEVYVNGRPLGDHPQELRHLDRLIIGPFVFRVAIPLSSNEGADDDALCFNDQPTNLHHLGLLEEYNRLTIHVEQAVAANGILDDARLARDSALGTALDDDGGNISETSPRFTEMNAGIDVEDDRYRMAAVENALMSSYPPLAAAARGHNDADAMKFDYHFAITERSEHIAALATLQKLADMKRKEAENDLEIERLKQELARKAAERVAKQMAAEEAARAAQEEEEKRRQKEAEEAAAKSAAVTPSAPSAEGSSATAAAEPTPTKEQHVDPTSPASPALTGPSAKDRWKKAVRKVSAVQSFASPNPASRVAAAAEEKLLLAFELQQHEEACRMAQAWQPTGPSNAELQKEYLASLGAPTLGAFREMGVPVFEGTVQKLRVKTGFFSRSGYHPVFLVVLPRWLGYFEKTTATCPARGCVFYYGAAIRACGLQHGKYAIRIDPSVPRKPGKAGNDNSVTLAVDTPADCDALVRLLQQFSLPEPTPRVAAFLEAQAAQEAAEVTRTRAESRRESDST